MTEIIESIIFDYSDAFMLVKGGIAVTPNDTQVAFKNCAPFPTCKTK